MKEIGGRVKSMDAHKRKAWLIESARKWEESLPEPSPKYPNLIFVYSEELATQGRDLLFRRLDRAAARNKQKLVISDCHYSRAGLHVSIDEIGGDGKSPVDIDEIIEQWREGESQGFRL